MDSRINSLLPTGPVMQRKLGDRSGQRERAFVLPRHTPSDEDDASNAEPGEDDPGVLSPQPRRETVAVSRVRLEDEAGQRIDLRG